MKSEEMLAYVRKNLEKQKSVVANEESNCRVASQTSDLLNVQLKQEITSLATSMIESGTKLPEAAASQLAIRSGEYRSLADHLENVKKHANDIRHASLPIQEKLAAITATIEIWGCGPFLGLVYIVKPKLSRYSIGLR